MKIGIISDSHDRIEATNRAIGIIKERGCKILVHCGDFCAPFMMEELQKFSGEVHCIFGNTDDRFTTPNKAKKLGINFHGDILELEVDGKKIAANHYPPIAEGLAATGKYDVVFYGHDHTANKKKIGRTLLVNPGEIMGIKGIRTLAIYDTKTDEIEYIEFEKSVYV